MAETDLQRVDLLVHVLFVKLMRSIDKIRVIVGRVQQLVRHMLIGIELVVEVVAVENQHALQRLQLEREAAAKSPRFDSNVISDIARDL